METQADPYPTLHAITGQVHLDPDQLFFYILSILVFSIIIALMTAASTAVNAITDKDIAALKKSDTRKEETLLKLLDRPASLQASITITLTVATVALVCIFSLLLSMLFSTQQHISLEILLFTVCISLYLLIACAYVPKVFAAKHYLAFSKWMVFPLIVLQWFFKPVIKLLLWLTTVINKTVPQKYRLSEEEFNRMEDSDLINEENEEEQMILKGIANFGNSTVKQIMTSRMDVVAFDYTLEFPAVFKKITDTRYSRIPVYEKNLDNIRGILFVKDILIHRDEENFNWHNLIRPAYFVPENKKIDDLLKEFRTKHTHIAIVADEYGGTSGIVTLEDILEEIVGDISDEYDEADDELKYSKLDDHTYVFDGKTRLNDLYRLLDLDESIFETIRGEADTIGGLVLAIAGRFLFINEKVEFENFIFTVESADRRRIKRVKVSLPQDTD